MTGLKRIIAIGLTLAAVLTLVGCQAPQFREKKTEIVKIPATPEPEITASPVPVLSGVETDRKVISLVFEGYTDTTTVESIANVLKQNSVQTIFFVSGITANEQPELLKHLVQEGFSIGNYGMNGAKKLEAYSAYENSRRFRLAQQEIQNACGVMPSLIRCNGTIYTENVLRAAGSAGLEAAVQPSEYVNHRSFKNREDADVYVSNLLRGGIISVKLGQELDRDEYGDVGEMLDERPAIDPSPGIRWEWSTEEEKYANLPDAVGWLIEALHAADYQIVSPEKIQSEARPILVKTRELDAEENKLLDAGSYLKPVTNEALSFGTFRKAEDADFENMVFVGGSAMEGLAGYVEWRRKEEPGFLGNATFITDARFTVERLIGPDEEGWELASALREAETKTVCLNLGFSNTLSYRQESHLANYRLLIRNILQENPDIRIIILPILPKVTGHAGISNDYRFRLNLMLCKMCREYNLDFVDIAWPLRDKDGGLREEYCLNLNTSGTQLNDTGCEVLLEYLKESYPD